MENASKALLIAGAILIAILLIGIAMMVFNNIGGITDIAGQQVDQMQITAFNRPFEQYEGPNVSGSNVRALISNINSSNATNANDESRQVKLTSGSEAGLSATAWSSGNPVKITGTIGSNYRYEVVFSTDNSGFINSVKINKK